MAALKAADANNSVLVMNAPLNATNQPQPIEFRPAARGSPLQRRHTSELLLSTWPPGSVSRWRRRAKKSLAVQSVGSTPGEALKNPAPTPSILVLALPVAGMVIRPPSATIVGR